MGDDDRLDAEIHRMASIPQIYTDEHGVHRDAEGRVYRVVEVDGETTYVVEGGEGER